MKKKKTNNRIMFIVLLLGSVIMLYPFVYMVLGSFMSNAEFKQIPPSIIPKKTIFTNYTEVFNKVPFLKMYLNSIIVMILRILFGVGTSIMAAYAFAKLRFPLKKTLFTLVILVMMFPSQIFIFPQFLILTGIQKTDTLFALLFPGLVSAYGIFYLRQQFMVIPKEIIESATLDGCGMFKMLYKIVVPMSKPGIVVLSLSTALWSWNDFMWPMIINQTAELQTLPVGIQLLSGHQSSNVPLQLAAATLSTIPFVVIYTLLQKFFEDQGFGSAVK